MSADKHTSYFNVLDALKSQTGCALCFLEAKAVRASLESVLYEGVNDPGVRAALERSKGYCRVHAEMLVCIGDAFGTAILYKDVVQDFCQFLDALGDRGRTTRSRGWREHAGCPACQIQHEARNRYAGTLLSALNQDEMRSAFDASAGLCVPHLLNLLEAVDHKETWAYLVETHRAKYGALAHELEEFCRKHDYRYSKEGLGPERDSWERAVRMVVGEI